MNEVVAFINRRFPSDCNWLNGNCLWFAQILKIRFPESEIYYLPIIGHFIIKYDDVYYDWRGVIEPDEEPIKWSDIEEEDPLWYSHLIRDCFY